MSARPWTYLWRHPVPADVHSAMPSLVRERLAAAALRDCHTDRCTPLGDFTVEIVDTGIDGWLEGRVAIPCTLPAARPAALPAPRTVPSRPRVPIAPLVAELDRRGGVSLALLDIDDPALRGTLWSLYNDAVRDGHTTPRNAAVLTRGLLDTTPAHVWTLDDWPRSQTARTREKATR